MRTRFWMSGAILVLAAGTFPETETGAATVAPQDAPRSDARPRPRVDFLGAGVHVQAHRRGPNAGAGIDMHLARFGRDGSARAVSSPIARTTDGERVEYRYGEGITEWYVDGPSGLEQGFTLQTRPAGHGELVLGVEFGAEVSPRVLEDGRGADLYSRAGRPMGRYADLQAKDASGRSLAARMVAVDGSVAIVVRDDGAHYPIVIDPTLTVDSDFLDPDVTGSDLFGVSVAVSRRVAVVGAYGDSSFTGAAYVFTESASGWSLAQKLVASDGAPNDYFGSSVAVSAGTVVVGAAGKAGLTGAAYVFVQSGGVWSQQQKLVAPDAAPNDYFGTAVAVSGDTAIVGAEGKISFGGAAYLFARSGTSWSEQAKVEGSDEAANDVFGESVALAPGTAVIGAPAKNSGMGAAYVFALSGSTWSQQAKIVASDGVAGDSFGRSVAVTGSTALVGSPNRGGGTGAAYVYGSVGGSWTQQQILVSSDGASNDFFGDAVSMQSSAAAVVGAPGKNSNAGAAYFFGPAGASWSQLQILSASGGSAGDGFGVSAATDGLSVFVGAQDKSTPTATECGAVYTFQSALSAVPALGRGRAAWLALALLGAGLAARRKSPAGDEDALSTARS